MRQISREGYLMIDHRASPGVDEKTARLGGYDPKQVTEGRMFESATLTCGHCKCVVVKNPDRLRERGYCRKCDHYICDICAKVDKCRPWAQVVDDVMDGKTPVPVLARDLKE